MTPSARPFGLSTGGYDRRLLADRRAGDRRLGAETVEEDRRSEPDRRSRGRRITEWFPVRPYPPLEAKRDAEEGSWSSADDEPLSGEAKGGRASGQVDPRAQTGSGESAPIIEYGYKAAAIAKSGQRPTSGGRAVVQGRPVRPIARPDLLPIRDWRAVEPQGTEAPREFVMTLDGKSYRVEDWTGMLPQRRGPDTAMWCVTSDGIIVGSFAAPSDLPESVLQERVAHIARGGIVAPRPKWTPRVRTVRWRRRAAVPGRRIFFVIALGILGVWLVWNIAEAIPFVVP